MRTAAPNELPPLIAHIIYRLDVGGLENGLVNLINGLPRGKFRHAVICLTDSRAFRDRLTAADVEVHELNKAEGKDYRYLLRLWKLLRRLSPRIVHTRNLTSLECQLVAATACTGRRIHGEHGWDMHDLEGTNRKYGLLRRALRPFVHRYIVVSSELGALLTRGVGIAGARVTRICNGVDTERFRPRPAAARPDPVARHAAPHHIVIGTVGRLQPVKDQLTLVRAFLRLVDTVPDARQRLRLALVGDGPLRRQAAELLAAHGSLDLAWLPGFRDDVADVMRGLDVFVLPSLKEGISNTILEAMATGRPVVATDVGGNRELVAEGETGYLVPAGDDEAMAAALRRYVDAPCSIAAHGQAGRRRAEREFSLERMVEAYASVYDAVMASARTA
jgi:sugar transferase (PEP-CTERM/EpsH1 system associated)